MDQEEEDKMKVIETTVPISIENLKIYFNDKETKFLIDYDNSQLKNEKFLIYLSNLDLPCDVKFDIEKEEHMELLRHFFLTKNIVNIHSLEVAALYVCLDHKYKNERFTKNFIDKNKDVIENWISLLESLSLYNFYCVESKKFKEFVQSHPKGDSTNVGLNFVNLLKYEDFGLIFDNTKKESLKYYEEIFNDYMFKGKNLYYYWSNENNILFLTTWKILHDLEQKKGTEENVSLI